LARRQKSEPDWRARETRALPGSEAGATRDFVRAASTINLYSFQ